MSALARPIVSTIALIVRAAHDLMPNGFFPPLVEIDTMMIRLRSHRESLAHKSIFGWTVRRGSSVRDDQLMFELSRATGERDTETPKASSSRLLSLNPATMLANTHSVYVRPSLTLSLHSPHYDVANFLLISKRPLNSIGLLHKNAIVLLKLLTS